jgi:hypothetical protein
MREDGTGTEGVDTIGTSYLNDGCLTLRADRAKINRSAHDSAHAADEPDAPA